MMHPDPPPIRHEWVTARGLDLLDELVGAVLECQLAVRSMQVDVGLTLDELMRDLTKARESASLAYGAASLVHQGADLASSWTDYPSRPKAVLARHRVAVQYGAPRKIPAVAVADRYEQAARDAHEHGTGEGRKHATETRTTGRRCGTLLEYEKGPCRRRVGRVGRDSFAEHCPDHMDNTERELHERHTSQVAKAVAKAHRDEFRRLADEWIAQRIRIRSWVQQVIQSTGWTS